MDDYEQAAVKRSPEHKRLKEDVSNTQKTIKKSNSRSDIYEEPLDQTYDRL